MDLEGAFNNSAKWRMLIYLVKTVIMNFTRRHKQTLQLALGTITLKHVEAVQCLGVELDPGLPVEVQVDHVCQVALGALNRLATSYNMHLYS